MMNTETPAAYLKPAEVALLLGKSVDWIRRNAANGTIPCRKIGKHLRFIRAEVDAWVTGLPGGPAHGQ